MKQAGKVLEMKTKSADHGIMNASETRLFNKNTCRWSRCIDTKIMNRWSWNYLSASVWTRRIVGLYCLRFPWAEIDKEYQTHFSNDEGQVAKLSRLAFGALYIKYPKAIQTRRPDGIFKRTPICNTSAVLNVIPRLCRLTSQWWLISESASLRTRSAKSMKWCFVLKHWNWRTVPRIRKLPRMIPARNPNLQRHLKHRRRIAGRSS